MAVCLAVHPKHGVHQYLGLKRHYLIRASTRENHSCRVGYSTMAVKKVARKQKNIFKDYPTNRLWIHPK